MLRFPRAFTFSAFRLSALLLGCPSLAQIPAPLLKAGPAGHYLTDENGTPFQLRGEAAWSLPVQLAREGVTAYLDDRQAKGFNAMLVEVINVNDGYATNAPKNAYGETPFQSADTRHLITTHWARNSTGTDGKPAWLTLNSSYTGIDELAGRILADYAVAPILPSALLESYYEGSLPGQPQLTTREVRGEAWKAYLSGACGNFYAHHSIWPFGSNWQAALGSPGALSIAKLNGFFAGLAWWNLIPDLGNTLVTGDKGSGRNSLSAARADVGSFAVIYVPTGGTFTVDLSRLTGKAVKATWFDPYSGATHAASASPLAKSARVFNPVGENGKNADPAAANDWVLLLESDVTAGILPDRRHDRTGRKGIEFAFAGKRSNLRGQFVTSSRKDGKN